MLAFITCIRFLEISTEVLRKWRMIVLLDAKSKFTLAVKILHNFSQDESEDQTAYSSRVVFQ